MSYSALISIFPGDEVIGECHACVSIDVQAPRSAPRGERARVEIHLFDTMPLSDELLKAVVGLFQPLGVGVGKIS